MKKMYMLDTNICSFIMREQPEAVLKRLEHQGILSPSTGKAFKTSIVAFSVHIQGQGV